MTSVLVVDLAGVLFRFDHEHRLAELGRCLGQPAARVDELLWESGFSHDCDAGRYPDAATVRTEIRRRTGYTGSDIALDQAWCSAFTPDLPVLDLVRAASLPRVIFTNNGPLEDDALPRLHPGPFALFGRRVFAWRLDANKPDSQAYEQVGRMLHVSPGEIAFIDDSPDNVEGARAVGWDAVLYRQPADLAALVNRL